jgi:hypothetical protein
MFRAIPLRKAVSRFEETKKIAMLQRVTGAIRAAVKARPKLIAQLTIVKKNRLGVVRLVG